MSQPEITEQPSGTYRASAPSGGPLNARVKHRWRSLAVLTAMLGMNNAEGGILVILFPAIRASLGLSLTDLGVLTAGAKVSGAIFSPLWAWLARRWNRKAVLFAAAGLWGVWGIGAGFADSFATLLVFYCVLAAGYAGVVPIITAILADLFDDATRGRAVGYLYGALSLIASVLGPALGQLSGIENGWRIGLWTVGSLNIAIGFLVFAVFRDPGLGASDTANASRNTHTDVSVPHALAALFRIRSFNIMLLSRLLSGQLLLVGFGVVYLTEVYGFSNQVAALVLGPFGLGYFLGAVGGAMVVDRMHRRWPGTGRVLFFQAAQFLFAAIAYFGTQFDWGRISIFMAFWFLMGLTMGVNPGVNRPIVMAVVPPALRTLAFAILVAIVESLTWALYNLGAGWLGDIYGLKPVFLAVLVGAMLANGIVVTLLYGTYARDVEAMPERGARRSQALVLGEGTAS
ncbi:MFS transporter [Aquabacter sp. CN5-332]|uniref:MFS transporter n=1 Tax=Aquabacter sp. CN5-332 TaxID=3156608 RepID=UPI0032B3B7A1